MFEINLSQIIAVFIGSSLAILVGNWLQSHIRNLRNKKSKYVEIGNLAKEMNRVYETRVEVNKERDTNSGDMTSGVWNEIREELADRMDKIKEVRASEIELDEDVDSSINKVEQKLIKAKREGLESHIDGLQDEIDGLKESASEKTESSILKFV
jgi:hypothetical protein